MSIWHYAEPSTDYRFTQLAASAVKCPFCCSPLLQHAACDEGEAVAYTHKSIRYCPTCGWWVFTANIIEQMQHPGQKHLRATAAVLRQFQPCAIDEPLQEVRRYLLARYDVRFQIHPRVYEDVVASVFRDLGFHAAVTAYSGDNGIDVVLTGPSDQQVGVQVKRHRNSIAAEAIRAFMGALVVNDMTQGVFVTTSRFQRGALRTRDTAAARGFSLELINADQFFEALRITRGALNLPALDSPIVNQMLDLGVRRLKTFAESLLEPEFI